MIRGGTHIIRLDCVHENKNQEKKWLEDYLYGEPRQRLKGSVTPQQERFHSEEADGESHFEGSQSLITKADLHLQLYPFPNNVFCSPNCFYPRLMRFCTFRERKNGENHVKRATTALVCSLQLKGEGRFLTSRDHPFKKRQIFDPEPEKRDEITKARRDLKERRIMVLSCGNNLFVCVER